MLFQLPIDKGCMTYVSKYKWMLPNFIAIWDKCEFRWGFEKFQSIVAFSDETHRKTNKAGSCVEEGEIQCMQQLRLLQWGFESSTLGQNISSNYIWIFVWIYVEHNSVFFMLNYNQLEVIKVWKACYFLFFSCYPFAFSFLRVVTLVKETNYLLMEVLASFIHAF